MPTQDLSPCPSADAGADHRIPSLDGLRAVSILLVLCSHMGFVAPPRGVGHALVTAVQNGGLGVSVFFVISGFLITRLLVVESKKTGTISLRAFYTRRVFRIFPAYYTTLAVLLVLGLVGGTELSWRCWLSSAFFVRNYAAPPQHYQNWVTSHFWSLAVEEQFYLFWPLTMLAAGIARSRRIAVALIVAAPFIRIATYFAWPSMRRELEYLTHARVDVLMFGCLPALLYDEPRFQAALGRVFRARLPLLAVVFLLFGSTPLQERFGGFYLLPIGWSLQGLSIALVMLWAIRHADTSLGRVLNVRVVTHVGILSYSLYLWQPLFLHFDPRWWSVPALVVIAECSYWLIEKPFLGLRKRWTAT